jgi:DNA-binding transcriptional LysR family regulator
MDVELRHLRVLVAVAEEGSLTRAGERLVLSQPAVSRALAQLERRLGVTLVERTSRHLALTEAGTRFADAAREALRAVDRAVDAVTAGVRPLRLGHTWAAAGHAATLLRAWNRRFERGSLVLERSEERTAGLASGDVDATLMWAAPRRPVASTGRRRCPSGWSRGWRR